MPSVANEEPELPQADFLGTRFGLTRQKRALLLSYLQGARYDPRPKRWASNTRRYAAISSRFSRRLARADRQS